VRKRIQEGGKKQKSKKMKAGYLVEHWSSTKAGQKWLRLRRSGRGVADEKLELKLKLQQSKTCIINLASSAVFIQGRSGRYRRCKVDKGRREIVR
jgi:hypothetical protein